MKYRCPICGTMQPRTHFACASGAAGGKKSRRTLTTEQARALVAKREANRAAKQAPKPEAPLP